MLSSGRRPWEGRGRGKRKREIGDGGGGRRCPLPPSYATDWGRGARILHRGGERVSPLRPIAFFFRFAPVSLFPECTLRCCPLPLSYGASLHPPRFIEDEQQHRSLSVGLMSQRRIATRCHYAEYAGLSQRRKKTELSYHQKGRDATKLQSGT